MATTTTTSMNPATGGKTYFGHPVGLFVLFFTEMWERFSYYGMRALLVLYMTSHLLQAARNGTYVFGFEALQSFIQGMYGPLDIQPLSSTIYGFYTGLVYFTPFFGGILADRVLGQRKSVYLGGLLMAIGHFLMAIESLFFLALLFLILGNGCFKPNISTQVGSLYPQGDERRDSAFSIFYMGINLGAFLAPLVCGTLGQVYGWHYGFGAAGIGMLIGLVVYFFGQKHLAEDQFSKAVATGKENEPLTSKEKKAVWGLVALCMLNIVFWAVYEQQGNTLQLFADENATWNVFGWTMPSTWFAAFNPMFIFLFTPFLTQIWAWQSKKNISQSSVVKMGIGCILLGASFLILILVTTGMANTDKISFLWLMLATAVLTIGEIYLSPIGLSLVTKVAPVRLASMLMGMWFLSSFFGNILSGHIGMFYSSMTRSGFFTMLLVLGVAAGLAIIALQKPLKSAIGKGL